MDWNNIQTWHCFAIIGGGVLVLGVILHFLPIGKFKIPSVITASFGALGLGLSLGITFMAGLGYKPFAPETPAGDTQPGPEVKVGGAGPPGRGKVGGGPGGPQAPKGKGGGGGAVSPRLQLASLVTALDSLSEGPITINLSEEDRKAIADQLKDLDRMTEIREEEAKAKLEAIQAIVLKDQKSLEKVGYRWVFDGKTANRTYPKDSPNPFKEEAEADRLKSLLERLSKN